jgi:cytochrome c oxidase cbb3-type subunit 4
MDWFTIIANTESTLALLAFLGIVWWAYSGRQRERFEQAAQAPFALPDEQEDRAERLS